MRQRLILILVGLVSSFAQNASQSPATLSLKHVSSQYKSLGEIRPVLVNEGEEAVFLSRIWPDGFAQLERLNDATGEWEVGAWGIRCATVSKPTIPIEVEPRAERNI